jgi:hypothetical protein
MENLEKLATRGTQDEKNKAKTQSNTCWVLVSNTYCVVFLLCFAMFWCLTCIALCFLLCFAMFWCPTRIALCFLLCFAMFWCLTRIALCLFALFCYVLVSNRYCIVFFALLAKKNKKHNTIHVRHQNKAKQNKNTTQYVLDTRT